MSEKVLEQRVLDKLAKESQNGTTWADWKRGEQALAKEGLEQAIKTKDVEYAIGLTLEEVEKEIEKLYNIALVNHEYSGSEALKDLKKRLQFRTRKKELKPCLRARLD